MCSTAREFTAPNLSCVRQGAHCDLFLLKLSDFQQKATDVAMLWCYIVVVLLYSLKFLSCQTLAKHPLEKNYLVPILEPDHLLYVINIMNINHNLRELNKSFFGSNSLYSLKNILDDQVLTYMWTIDFFILLETISKGKRLLIYRFKSWIYFQKSLFPDLFFPKYNHTHTHVYWKLILMKHHYSEWELFLWITTRLDPVFYKGSLYK